MGMGNVKVIDVNGGVTVAGRSPKRNSYIGGLVNERRYAYRELNFQQTRKIGYLP